MIYRVMNVIFNDHVIIAIYNKLVMSSFYFISKFSIAPLVFSNSFVSFGEKSFTTIRACAHVRTDGWMDGWKKKALAEVV